MGDTTPSLRYVDVSSLSDRHHFANQQIGINLSDPVFSGEYHGRQVHDNDMDDIIDRARNMGCQKFMVTGSDLEESRRAIQIASKYRKCVLPS